MLPYKYYEQKKTSCHEYLLRVKWYKIKNWKNVRAEISTSVSTTTFKTFNNEWAFNDKTPNTIAI